MTPQDVIQNEKFALLCGQTPPVRNETTSDGSATILGRESLTQGKLRYWTATQRKLVGKVDLVDPARESLKDLRARLPKGTRVYRASTGGKWGKSSCIVTL